MPATNINQLPPDCYIAIRDNGNKEYSIYYSKKNGFYFETEPKKRLGFLTFSVDQDNRTGLIYRITNVGAQNGFGPLLYDIAMEMVNKLTNGRGYLKSDPVAVTKSASHIWDNYFKRSDVQKRPLDSLENQITPTKMDNVNLSAAKEYYGDNPKLSGPQQPWYNKPLSNGYQKSISNLNSDKILVMKESKIKTIEFILNEGIERVDKPEFKNFLAKEYVTPNAPKHQFEHELNTYLNFFKEKITDTVQPFNGRIKEILINWLISRIVTMNIMGEDIGFNSKGTEYFQNFLKYSPKFKNGESKDINTYKTLADIFKAYKPYKDLDNQGFKFDPKSVKDSKVIYEDENYLIMSPLTEQASCELGKDTEWCTAKYKPGDYRNMFNHYNKSSPLYILFNKKTGEKTQYHIDGNQMMDENDADVFNIEFYKLLYKLNLLKNIKIIDLKNGGILIHQTRDSNQQDIKSYYNKNGKLHRLDGPAYIRKNPRRDEKYNIIYGSERYYIDGSEIYSSLLEMDGEEYLQQHPEERGLTSEPLEESKIKTKSINESLDTMNQKQMIIMRGLPGSGKSTLIKQKYPNAKICSADHYFEDKKFDPALLTNAHLFCLNQAIKYINEEQPLIVIDNTNTKKWEFQKYIQLANENNYSIHYENVFDGGKTDEELFARNVHNVPLHTITNMRNRWEK